LAVLVIGVVGLVVAAQSHAESRVLRLASLEWEPYIGSSLPAQGYAAEVVRTACARKQVQVEIDFLPWARALMLARRGEYHGVFPEYYDPSREAEFTFSAPFPGGAVGLYKRRFSPIRYASDPRTDLEGALRSLTNYRIGVVRDYLNNPVFDAATYLRKEDAASDEVNLRKLYFGRVDLVFVDRLVAEHLLKTHLSDYHDTLEMLEPPIEDKPLYVAYSRKAPDTEALRQACDAGLAEIGSDGTLAQIRAKHGLPAVP
jgi:ABC-type amino acid transport substrate-binding protein